MKNILIIFAMFVLIFTSCTKDDPNIPEPEPTPDYESMKPKIKERLFNHQTALNEKDYATAIEITINKDKIELGIYPTPSVASQATSKVNHIRTLSAVTITSTSKVASGTITFTGKQEIVIKKQGIADKKILLIFTATFTCHGDKMTAEDWKLNFKATK